MGAGPFKFVSRETAEDGSDAKVTFARNDKYWGQKPKIETLTAVQYKITDEAEAALKSGELDMAMGIGPLNGNQIQDLKFYYSDQFCVRHSNVIQHSILVFNNNRAPMDDIKVWQAVIHTIDKSNFLESEFAGLEQPVTQLLPISSPYCNVDLSPKWGYDIDKAQYLNCPEEADVILTNGAIAEIVVASIAGVALIGLLICMIYGERQGKPVFSAVRTEIN